MKCKAGCHQCNSEGEGEGHVVTEEESVNNEGDQAWSPGGRLQPEEQLL